MMTELSGTAGKPRHEANCTTRVRLSTGLDNDVALGSTDSGLGAVYRPVDIDRFRRNPEYTRARRHSSRHRNFSDLHKTNTPKELRPGI